MYLGGERPEEERKVRVNWGSASMGLVVEGNRKGQTKTIGWLMVALTNCRLAVVWVPCQVLCVTLHDPHERMPITALCGLGKLSCDSEALCPRSHKHLVATLGFMAPESVSLQCHGVILLAEGIVGGDFRGLESL